MLECECVGKTLGQKLEFLLLWEVKSYEFNRVVF